MTNKQRNKIYMYKRVTASLRACNNVLHMEVLCKINNTTPI